MIIWSGSKFRGTHGSAGSRKGSVIGRPQEWPRHGARVAEWQERKWQLALGAAWMLCGSVYVVWYETAHRFRAPVASLYSVASMFGLLAMPLLHATMYAVTVLGVCWLRQPIDGAVAGVLTYALVTTLIGTIPGAVEFDPLSVYNGLFHDERTSHVLNLRDHNYLIVYGTLAALTLAAAILAVPAILKPTLAVCLFTRRERQFP